MTSARPERPVKVFTEQEWAEIVAIAATIPRVVEEYEAEKRRKAKEFRGAGQSGALLLLRYDQLNYDEKKLLRHVASSERKTVQRALLWKAFPAREKSKAIDSASNALRRLIRAGFMEKVGRGEYRISPTGKKAVKEA